MTQIQQEAALTALKSEVNGYLDSLGLTPAERKDAEKDFNILSAVLSEVGAPLASPSFRIALETAAVASAWAYRYRQQSGSGRVTGSLGVN